MAGLSTFLTINYIVVVNPAVVANNPQTTVQDGISMAGHSTAEVRAMLAVVTILAATFVICFLVRTGGVMAGPLRRRRHVRAGFQFFWS
jgi:xanthine/uracil/vitamin C permease (AzgA family)